jgi:GT2 family glycosyltransferase
MSTKLGVVILNFITYEDTIHYVKNDLYNQKDIELKIVIVDNASPNNSFQKLKEAFANDHKVILINNHENKGYATGNNIGIKLLEELEYEYILITNNDIRIEDDSLLSEMLKRYEKLESPAFVSPVMFVNSKVSRKYSAWKLPSKTKEILDSTYLFKFLGYPYLKMFYYKINPNSNVILKVDCLPGSFFMGKSSVFKAINYFDEQTFLYFEETILGNRVKKNNLINYLFQDLKYDHHSSQSIDKYFNNVKKHKLLLISRCYYWKHYMDGNTFFLNILKFCFNFWTTEYWIIINYSKLYKQLHFRK